MRPLSRLAGAALAAGALAGCASVRSPDPRDPWEPTNRAVFEFNDAADRALFKPLAEGYRAALPETVRTGVHNFFANLRDPWIALNQLLQGKVEEALSDLWRFIANSTFGIGGIFDIASDMGMPKHNEDFGQTLAVWGVDFGPYLVIPILGPSSVRDGSALVAAAYAYLPWQLPDWLDVDHRVTWQYSLSALDFVQTRASLLDATDLLEQAALDRYAFVRNAYFQRRRNLIYDGKPPPPPAGENESRRSRGDRETSAGGAAAGAGPARQLVDPKVPANYEAVLAADAARGVGAAPIDLQEDRP